MSKRLPPAAKSGAAVRRPSAARRRADRAASTRPRVPKTAISNPAVLNEAYDYARPVSFSRGMCVELDNCRLVFISGTAAVDEAGRSVHPGDVRAQARRLFANVTGILASAGADWHDVVRTTCYLADFRLYDAFNEVRNAFYAAQKLDPLPASTCVEARLCRPELLVEMEALAVVPRPTRPRPARSRSAIPNP